MYEPNQKPSRKKVPDTREKIQHDKVNKPKKEDKDADHDNSGRRNHPF